MTIVERIENKHHNQSIIAADIKEIYAEARNAGYDPKYIKKAIALHKRDAEELYEEMEMAKIYVNAIDPQLKFEF
jgi:uncharacterized protein (UPF0335 family)